MTAREMNGVIGRVVNVRFESLTVTCKVVDAKTTYGKTRILIAPVTGDGTQWIECGRVTAFIDGIDCPTCGNYSICEVLTCGGSN